RAYERTGRVRERRGRRPQRQLRRLERLAQPDGERAAPAAGHERRRARRRPEQRDSPPAAGRRDRRRGAGDPAAHDQNVEFPGHARRITGTAPGINAYRGAHDRCIWPNAARCPILRSYTQLAPLAVAPPTAVGRYLELRTGAIGTREDLGTSPR